MKPFKLFLVLFFCFTTAAFAKEKDHFLIDDFEEKISGGADGTVDFGADNGSSVEVSAATNIKHSGVQSLKITFNAVPKGYIYVAKGFYLDAHNAGWLITPEAINWEAFDTISFYMYGSDSKANIAFDLKDDGNETWRFIIEDDFKGWKELILPFSQFVVRGDWQSEYSDNNMVMNFPIKSFQFEPLPPSKGTIYIDQVSLITKPHD